jgi:two-component system, chemotaxis family, sensor kinase CheA
VRAGGSAFAVAVDDIVGQHQVVIKSLGAELKDVKGFAGGAILGDGKAAMIIDLPEMIANISLRPKNLPQMRGAA